MWLINFAKKIMVLLWRIFLVIGIFWAGISIFLQTENITLENGTLATLLGIVLAFIAIISVLCYKLIWMQIKEDVDKEREFSKAEILLTQGYLLWRIYEKHKDNNLLTEAITYTEGVIIILNPFERKLQRKYGKFICIAKGNLAYYLAERGRTDDKEKIKALMGYVLTKKRKYPSCAKLWTDDCSIISQKFPGLNLSCDC